MSDELPSHALLSAGWQAALPAVYEELRRLAAGYMRGERPDHTLQPTALVHEVVLRLHDQHSLDWQNRAELFGVAAHMMRRVLSSHAAAHRAAKRGGGSAHVTLDAALDFCDRQSISLAALDDALRGLEAFDPVQGRIVELRFFGGLTVEEVAGGARGLAGDGQTRVEHRQTLAPARDGVRLTRPRPPFALLPVRRAAPRRLAWRRTAVRRTAPTAGRSRAWRHGRPRPHRFPCADAGRH